MLGIGSKASPDKKSSLEKASLAGQAGTTVEGVDMMNLAELPDGETAGGITLQSKFVVLIKSHLFHFMRQFLTDFLFCS